MASPNARSGWLSTRNKTKITPKQPTLRKRGSLTKFKASTSSFLLTQNSPPAQQLLAATRQTTVTHFFKQASEGTFDDVLDYQTDMEDMDSDNSIATGNKVEKLHNITDPDDDLITEKGDDFCKHADLVNHSSHSCGFSDGPGLKLFKDSGKEIPTSLSNETAYADCYSSTLNEISNLDASVDEDIKKHKSASSKSINSTDTKITSYKDNHTHVEQCQNDPTIVSHGQYNNLVLNAGTDQHFGQFSRKRRLSDHDRYAQACTIMPDGEQSDMATKRHKIHHLPTSRMVSAKSAQCSTERTKSTFLQETPSEHSEIDTCKYRSSQELDPLSSKPALHPDSVTATQCGRESVDNSLDTVLEVRLNQNRDKVHQNDIINVVTRHHGLCVESNNDSLDPHSQIPLSRVNPDDFIKTQYPSDGIESKVNPFPNKATESESGFGRLVENRVKSLDTGLEVTPNKDNDTHRDMNERYGVCPVCKVSESQISDENTENRSVCSVDDQSESPILQKDTVKQSVCSVKQSGSQSSHKDTGNQAICSVDDHSEFLISAEHQDTVEDSINFSLESGLEFNVDGDSEFTLRSQRMKFDRLETRVKEMAGHLLEDTLTLGLDSQFY